MSSVQHNNPKLLWGITAGLAAIIAIFALYQWLFAAQEPTTPVLHQAELIQPTVKALPEAEKAASTAMADNTIKLVEEDILKAPVPENASLAKEEVAKLTGLSSVVWRWLGACPCGSRLWCNSGVEAKTAVVLQ